MSGWSDRIAVLDLETTGIDPAESRIVSAFVGLLDRSGRVVERREWIADPGVEIPGDAVAVHGITTERVRAEGRPTRDVVREIVGALRGYLGLGIPLVVYNAPFDLGVLHHEAIRSEVEPLVDPAPIVDPLVVDRAVDPGRPGRRGLSDVADLYGVDLDDPHTAAADAVAAGRIAQAIDRHFDLDMTARELHDRQRVWFADQAAGWAAWLLAEKGRVSDESDQWPVVVEGRGRHRRAPLRIAAAVIAREDGALLFVRKRGTTALMQPGGKLEPTEAPSAALIRELEEELGLRVRVDELTPVGRFEARAANEPGTTVDAVVYAVPLTGEPVAAAEIDEVVWIHPDAETDRELAPLSGEILIPWWLGRRR